MPAGPPNITAASAGSAGCTVAGYGTAKQLPESFLKTLGLTDLTYMGAPAVRIPYFAADGTDLTVQFRLHAQRGAGTGPPFKWKVGSKPHPYGLNRLADAKTAGYVIVVEGPSDTQTLWFHDYPALGLPSACWKEEWASHFDGIDVVYIVQEPGRAGERLIEALENSTIRDRVRIIDLGSQKDPSGLYLDDPARFKSRWDAAMTGAVSWEDREQREREERSAKAWQQCATLARISDILTAFAEEIRKRGLVGEGKIIRLVYLIMTSRMLDRIVSLVMKGASSAGKSFIVERVLEFFPESSYVKLTAMSEKALLYDETDVSHRMLVIAEAPGAEATNSSYYLRTLLSEGRLSYKTVEKTSEGLRSRTIHREGPTGLIVTTTAVALHHENETRLLSLTVNDTPQHTRAILMNAAAAGSQAPIPEEWLALQEWIALSKNRVVIPFAEQLASMIPPVAIRLRRDFKAVLSLIEAHAVLHQASRLRDAEGRIIATEADYAAVRELVAEVIAQGVESAVPPLVRETVTAVQRLATGGTEVSVAVLAKELGIDASVASRRAADAEGRGYLSRAKDGRSKRLVPDAPLPGDVVLLPEASTLFPSVGTPPIPLAPSIPTPGPVTPPDDGRIPDSLIAEFIRLSGSKK